MTMPPLRILHSGFLQSVEKFADRPALEVSGQGLTYRQLFQKAASLAGTLSALDAANDPPLTAVFAYRSVTAFSGVLAALLRGHGYVPLNRTFPPERTRTMLQRAGCRAVVVDAQSESQLGQVLEGIDRPLVIVLPDRDDLRELAARWPRHKFIGGGQLASSDQWRRVEASPDSIAYLLFTSGSTGVPKGVMVAHRNATHYVDFIADRFGVTHEDRFSQTFDMTFDLSVADMFVAWERGACVCCPSEKTLINPGRFINDSRLTIWFSVPSTAVFMKRLGTLKPGLYPRLRASMFCGEALPVDVARAWSDAAPNSIVENLYGPTELAIACTFYRWDPVRSDPEAERGIVPIGQPFPGMVALVADESFREVAPGADGELLMTGPQMSLGYWRDPEKTAASFITPPGRNEVYYRTGDRVRRPLDGQPMVYLGRVDNQIKVLGHRVELGEVEAALRELSGIESVAAFGWPLVPGGASGIEAFLQTESVDAEELLKKMSLRLPAYMVPRKLHCRPVFPLNANGKIDRKALVKVLETANE
ncbi:MAG TPA: amino acid adenylation domain-containing protein [Verrucomicrobiae bacterium]|nr:amino acid adenylation domain-containing protein [Verrucomicrobiae bacterium]